MDKLRSRSVKGFAGAMIALLVILAMFIGFMPQAYAAEPVADEDTRSSYSDALGDNNSTRYNGRVWADKSVSTENVSFTGGDAGDQTVEIGDSDFLTTYSLLATSTSVAGESSVPVDVVFVIDNSNSMDDSVGGGSRQTRLEATVDAVNASIAKLMESNADSRVGVVIYGYNASTILPLGHYDADRNGNYIDCNFQEGQNSFTSVGIQGSVSMGYYDRGTNVQAGTNAGLDMLSSATNIGTGASKHVPAMVLLSDGAATGAYSDSDWWDPNTNNINEGGTTTYSSYIMRAIMNASYKKQIVNQHYGITDAASDYACKIYTIGMGLNQLTGSSRNYAQIALDPGAHLNDNNNEARTIANAWNQYSRTWNNRPTLNGYTFNHPSSNDISTIAYNDNYYSAENAQDVVDVFDDITSTIVTSRPQVPTEVTGSDPVHDGYVTYTDPIGQYMQVDDVKTLIYAGKRFDRTGNPQTTGNKTTYQFTGTVNSPVYGDHDVSEIEITVTTADNGDQTLTVRVPASVIPVRVNTVTTDANGAITNTANGVLPLRLLYTVSLKDGIVDNNDNIVGDVSQEYLDSHTVTLQDGSEKVNFYSNKYTEGGYGDATVSFKPASTNPFYFVQENTPLYVDGQATTENNPGYLGQPARGDLDPGTNYYFQIQYYAGNQQVTAVIERSGADLQGTFTDGQAYVQPTGEGGQLEIQEDAPRIGNLQDLTAYKADGDNSTETAVTYRYPTWDSEASEFDVYLGNNGRLQVNPPASLTIAKAVTTDDPVLTAPDEDFTFQVTAAGKTGDVSAVLHDTDEQGQPTATDTTVDFGDNGTATVTLKAGQSLEIKGMTNTEYTVQETDIPDGFTLTGASAQPQGAGSFNNTDTVTGTIGTDNVSVTFTNTYGVSDLTVDPTDLGIDGTKTITGRDFQPDDEFTFQIAPSTLTPDAPLPGDAEGNAQVTIKPDSGTTAGFDFTDAITYTQPGEYRYIITEVSPATSLPGITYNSTNVRYRLIVTVTDNGNGTLSQTHTLEVATTDNVWNTAQTVTFNNNYNEDAAGVDLTGSKVLEGDRAQALQEKEFTFIITGEGSAPMPAETEVGNASEGYIFFRDIPFTQADVGQTYTYRVTEKQPTDTGAYDGNGLDGATKDDQGNWVYHGVTYDHFVKTITVEVNSRQVGGQATIVATIGGENNFQFTNTYAASGSLSGAENLKVSKALTGREWKDGETFTFQIAGDNNAPMPAQTMVTVNEANPTDAFGDINYTAADAGKTYTYTITEQGTDENGLHYSDASYRVTVRVEDNNDGTLNVTSNMVKLTNDDGTTANNAAVDNKTAAFINDYKATFDNATAVDLTGTKNLTVGGNSDKTLEANAFYFNVTPLNNAPTGTSVNRGNSADDTADNGTFTGSIPLLQNVTYTQKGIYQYIVTEQIPQPGAAGMTYDSAAYQVTVEVTDDSNGTLSAGAPQIVKGTYENGTFTQDADQTGVNGVVFNNSYTPEPVTIGDTTNAGINVRKTFTGHSWTNAYQFEYTLKAETAGAPMPTSDKITVKGPADASSVNRAAFGTMTFDSVGVYEYSITETNAGQGGITYDTHTAKVTVTVSERDGKLAAAIAYDNTAATTDADKAVRSAAAFTNTYSATGSLNGAANLTVTKEFTGRPNDAWLDTDSFSFKIEGSDEATKIAIDDGKITLPGNVTIDSASVDHQEAFDDIVFNAPGEYRFEVTEFVPEDEEALPNVDYDDTIKYISVNVTDNGDGKLTAEVVDENSDALTFTNTYTPDQAYLNGATNLKVNKNFTGRDNNEWLQNDTFTFTLAPGNSETQNAVNNQIVKLPAETTLAMTRDNASNAFFGNITFTQPGTYVFTVTESTGASDNGITYDTTPRTITVVVTDQNDGTMKVEVDAAHSEALEFNNTYKPSDGTLIGTENLKVTKALTGRDWTADDAFTFTVTADPSDETTVKAVEEQKVILPGSLEVTEANKDSAAFGNITFKEEGIYKFIISEVEPEDDPIAGVDYDKTQHAITVNVEDNDQGALVATLAQGSSNTSAFKNEYHTTGSLVGADNLMVTKTIEKRDWIEGDSFTFTLAADMTDAATAAAVNAGQITLPSNAAGITIAYNAETPDAAHEAAFGDITFTAEGTYRFTIAETEGNIGGMTYDANVKTITVTTEDNGDGTLSITQVTGDKNPTFTNTYAPDQPTQLSGAENLKVTKTIDNRNWQTGDSFTFTLTGGDEATNKAITDKVVTLPENAAGITIAYNAETPDAAHEAAFGDITFTQPGDYVFNITEQKGTIGGMIYDETNHVVKVHVKDNLDGTLTATVTEGANPTITNTYVPNVPGELNGAANLTVTKNFTGRENDAWLDTDSFSFKLEAADEGTKAAVNAKEITMPANADKVEITADTEGHKAAFGNINFTKAGDYTFNISEILPDGVTADNPTKDGITYDTSVKTVKVTVTDNLDGTLTAALAQSSEALTFTNTYSTTDVPVEPGDNTEGSSLLNVTKELTGREWKQDDSFTFTIEGADDKTMAAIADGTITMPNPASVTIDNTTIDTATQKHTAGFGEIVFNKVGTYKFNIKETKPETAIPGITYDAHTYTVTITVTDNHDGTLKAVVTGEAADSTFTNAYTPTPVDIGDDVNTQLAGTKVLNGKTLKAGEFSFTVEPQNGAPTPEGGTTVTNTADTEGYNFGFGNITFDKPGTYTYLVKEVNDNKAGYTYDDTTYTVTYTVTDNVATGKLELSRAISVDGEAREAIVFNNSFTPAEVSAPAALSGTKTVEGNAYTMQGGEFTFELVDAAGNVVDTATNTADGTYSFDTLSFAEEGIYKYTVREVTGSAAGMSYDGTSYSVTYEVDYDAETGVLSVGEPTISGDLSFTNTYDPTDIKVALSGTKVLDGRDINDGEFQFVLYDENGEEVATATNVGNGFTFPAINYTAAGDYTYTIAEVNNGLGGVAYDESTHDVTVHVTDEGGALAATVEGGDAVVFKNTYTPAPATVPADAETGLGGAKTLEGRALAEGEFTFELRDNNGALVAETTNAADGSFSFEGITFDQEGTYTYTVSEVDNGLGGVAYDSTVYRAVITVIDNGEGQLVASVDKPDGAFAFTNTYQAAGVNVTMTAIKKLEGADLTDGQFTFVLKDADGKTVQEVTNTADGRIPFDTLTFDAAGEYTYTIEEVKGNDRSIAYDDTVYPVVINVTDDGNGALNADVTYTDGDPIFVNTANQPTTIIDNVYTGIMNNAQAVLTAFVCIVVAILAATALIVRRKHS